MSAARCLLCTALIVAAPGAWSAPKSAAKAKPQGSTATVGLIVLLGSGKAPADADAAIAAFQRSGATSSVSPTRLLSTDVKGLKPGYHIAVLGACARAEAKEALERVREVVPDAYLRWVPKEGAVAAMECPTVQPAAPTPTAAEASDVSDAEACSDCPSKEEQTLTFEKGGLRLEVTLTTESASYAGEFETSEWSAVAELRKGDTVASKQLRAPNYARVERFDVTSDGVVLDTYDLSSNCVGSEFYDGGHVHRLLRIVKGALSVQEQEEPDWGMCQPSNEGVADCTFGCQMSRYEAVKDVCTGPKNRERCMEALERYDQEAAPCTCGGDGQEQGD